MIDKIKNYAIIALFLVLVGFYFYNRIQSDSFYKEIIELKKARKNELKEARDVSLNLIDSLLLKSSIKYDSLLLIKQKIKYVPYEKYIYSNRNLDDALDIFSRYKYNKGAEVED